MQVVGEVPHTAPRVHRQRLGTTETTQIDGHAGTMAERVVQRGAIALGTTQAVAQGATLAPYPTDIYATKHHLAALIDR